MRPACLETSASCLSGGLGRDCLTLLKRGQDDPSPNDHMSRWQAPDGARRVPTMTVRRERLGCSPGHIGGGRRDQVARGVAVPPSDRQHCLRSWTTTRQRRDNPVASNWESRPWSVWFPAVLGLVGALLGGLISLGATAYSTNRALSAQTRQQQAEFDEAHKETQRKLRSQAYVKFLQALDAYSEQYSPLFECAEIPAPERTKYAVCLSYGASEPAVWLNLRAALDQVFLYGSDTSIRAANLYISQIANDRSRRRALEAQRKRAREAKNDLLRERARLARLPKPSKDDLRALQQLTVELNRTAKALFEFTRANIAELRSPPNFAAYRSGFQLIMCSELNTLPRGECK